MDEFFLNVTLEELESLRRLKSLHRSKGKWASFSEYAETLDVHWSLLDKGLVIPLNGFPYPRPVQLTPFGEYILALADGKAEIRLPKKFSTGGISD